MPQIFPRQANTLANASIAALVILTVLTLAGGYVVVRSPYVTRVGIAEEQPVPFSHAHHVGDIGIDCRYCHTSVEESSFAGLPSTSICMQCHSQIWSDAGLLEPVRESAADDTPISWTRVHDLPDFVYFNHSIHLNKGVGCVTCHGQVNEMPLTQREHSLQMQWCLDCHRHPEKQVRPTDEVFSVDWKPPANRDELAEAIMKTNQVKSRTDCYTCHR